MERQKKKIKYLVDKYLLGHAEMMGHRENFDQTDLAKFALVYLAHIFSTELTKNSFGFSIRC